MTKKNWWIWERPASIHLLYTAAVAAMYPLKKETGECYCDYLYGFFHKGMVRWICDLDKLIANGKRVIPRFLDEKDSKELDKRWNSYCDNLRTWFKKLGTIDLKEIDDKELLQLYTEFDNAYKEWWAFGQVAELIAYGGEDILRQKLSKEHSMKYFGTLVTPTKRSYSNEEEDDMFKLVKIAKSKGIQDNMVKELIKKHVEEYYWIHNNFYETKKLDEEYFTAEIKKHIKEDIDLDKLKKDNEQRLEKVKKEKTDILNKIKADDETIKLVSLLDDFCHFQDLRKALDMRANGFIDSFCIETARRKNIDYDILTFAFPNQIRDILSGKVPPVDIIKKQKENCLIIFNDRSETPEIYTGDEVKKKEREILGEQLSNHEQTEILGMCASTGRCTGSVRKLINPDDIGKLIPGEILVTTMTTPNFVSAMKKAAAIVTDEGGITSHAAIISRELGIPCVIGTKIATKLLNDGDMVEVKANHGIVRVIKDE